MSRPNTAAVSRVARRPLRWVTDTPGFIHFVDDSWPGRTILLAAQPSKNGMTIITEEGLAVELQPEWAYWVTGHQDNLRISGGPVVLDVFEDETGYCIRSARPTAYWTEK